MRSEHSSAVRLPSAPRRILRKALGTVIDGTEMQPLPPPAPAPRRPHPPFVTSPDLPYQPPPPKSVSPRSSQHRIRHCDLWNVRRLGLCHWEDLCLLAHPKRASIVRGWHIQRHPGRSRRGRRGVIHQIRERSPHYSPDKKRRHRTRVRTSRRGTEREPNVASRGGEAELVAEVTNARSRTLNDVPAVLAV